MLTIPIVILIAIPFVLANNSLFFWYPFIPVALSVITYFLYDIKEEKATIMSIVGLYALFTFFSVDILELMLGHFPIQEYITKRQVIYRTNPLLIFAFINIIMYYAFKQVQKNETLLLEAKSELEQANAAKDKFFSILSHDLKGSFSSALGLSKLMHDRFDQTDPKELKSYSEMLYRSCDNTQNLLNSLLEWSRTQTGSLKFRPELIDFNKILDETLVILSNIAEEKSISIINKVEASIPLFADHHMIKSILRNIISNSLKFTREGGTITVNSMTNVNHLTISIADTGVGMSPITLSKLFELDSKISEPGTNNEKGTGLGLLLVKEFTDQHQGRIWVESEEGQGSQFHIELPLKKPSIES
ncbi:MAG: HAMP domain-containing histidine kinase [Reichenbachiella sp.]